MTTEAQAKKNYKSTLNLPRTDFPMEAKLVQNEPIRLRRWEEGRLYEKIQTARAASGKGKWILHDGPPFANGDIHIGHLINKTLKDVILRFRTMQGYQTPYVPGWDCHGLPIEHKIQEEIKKEGKNIREMSTLEVRQRCHQYAQKYVAVQCEQFKRLGILGEWNHPYLTMSPEYEAAALEVFAKFVEADLVYRKLRPVPWSIANQTALADAELEYQDVQDDSVYVEFPLVAKSGEFLLIWTTTPWTLPANLAVAVHPEVEYVRVHYERFGQSRVGILAADLATRVFAAANLRFEILASIKGVDLAGTEYRHPFVDRIGKVVLAEYVTTTDGTGLVHTAPGHGEDDFETGIREKLEIYSPVLANGRFDDTVPDWLRGKTVKEANPLIVERLKSGGFLFAQEKITHSYPHDWRSKTPIIFRATEQWFVAMDKPFTFSGAAEGPRCLRQRAMDAIAAHTEFFPAWGRARITGMLDTRPDWCISRQRAWGLPIPVFYNEKGEPLLTPQSVRAVAKSFAEKGSDIWFTETPTELLACDQTACPIHFGDVARLRKEKDIFDVWFESGSSWNAVLKSRSYLKFPADMYLEGSDQHRGWFQLSLLLALGVTGQPPFREILTHGFTVKPDGTKVSKSDKEYVTATAEIDRHGADVLRLWSCSVDYQNDVPVSPKVLQEFADKYRKIRNTLRYLLSNMSDFDPRAAASSIPQNSLDGWALDQLGKLIVDVTAAFDSYQLHRAFRILHDFCSVQISAIYGNAMKDRLYCDASDSPLRRRCQAVMHRMVLALAKLLAPMIVFTADEVWDSIPHKPAGDADSSSVHLALLPEASGQTVDDQMRGDWNLLMQLRDSALAQLDSLKKEVGLNKALDAELIYHVADENLRNRLAVFGPDLEDIVGAGYHSIVVDGPTRVEVIDTRGKYHACVRSWKRRPDVGRDAEYPDLSLRDAQVVRGLST